VTACAGTADPASTREGGAEPVEDFLRRLADVTPAPGGGAGAALGAATAAALVAMVARVARARGGPAGAVPPADTEARADAHRERLVRMMTLDGEAYLAVVEAGRRPPADRAAAREAALRHATVLPVELARRAGEVLDLGQAVAAVARPSTLSDLGVAAALAGAALEAAALIARANLRALDDAAFTTEMERALREATAAGERARSRIMGALAGRS
jgi:formiminotetrahydrofolate cyclodeaminase